MEVELAPLPMVEAQSYWADKVQMEPDEFKRLFAEAKVKAFGVAGIALGDELDTVFRALKSAMDSGIALSEFKKTAHDVFERRGWSGNRAWRVDNIFRTNIQTAYNVGHYRQQTEDSDIQPYWMYSAINDSRVRPTHLAMNGRVWPANDPIWREWYPPNGYS